MYNVHGIKMVPIYGFHVGIIHLVLCGLYTMKSRRQHANSWYITLCLCVREINDNSINTPDM